MGWFRATRTLGAFDLTAAAIASSTVDHDESSAAAGRFATMTPADFLVSSSGVLRETAHAVPAYRRARTLVAQSIAQANLVRVTAARQTVAPDPFLRRPDPKRTAFAFWFDIVGDLADYGYAYAANVSGEWRFPDAGELRKFANVERVDPEKVTELDLDGVTYYEIVGDDGYVRRYPAAYVLRFECASGGWLKAAARAVSTSLMLEESARRYAETPQATTILSNAGPRKTPEQVAELLDAWETARRTRSTAYVGRDITAESVGFDATQIALSDARAAAILDVARATGIPSLYLGQGPNDASMTYSNMTQQRLDLYAAFQPFAVAIEQRLSFDDVTGVGTSVRFDFGQWLRADPVMRANLYAQLVPLGVMTVDEARAFEDLVTIDPPNTTEGTS